MSAIQIFDPALCCSSGVCGTEVDQALVTFAADLAWAKEQGVAIERFNLAQQPMQFAETPAVSAFLTHAGEEGLPLVLVEGQVVLTGRYPSRSGHQGDRQGRLLLRQRLLLSRDAPFGRGYVPFSDQSTAVSLLHRQGRGGQDLAGLRQCGGPL